MLKKILVVSALAVGLAPVAFAGDLMERPAPAPVAVAPVVSDAGFYAGVEGGYVDTGWDNLDVTSNQVVEGLSYVNRFSVDKDTGLGGRLFVGYDINKYFAVEGGYTYFDNKAKVSAVNEGKIDLLKVKTQAFDLFGKIKAPVADNVNLYAKLGAGYLMSKIDFLVDQIPSTHHKKLCLAYGAGADYAVTSNVILNAEWFRYAGNPKLEDAYQPATNAFMVGVGYKFNF